MLISTDFTQCSIYRLVHLWRTKVLFTSIWDASFMCPCAHQFSQNLAEVGTAKMKTTQPRFARWCATPYVPIELTTQRACACIPESRSRTSWSRSWRGRGRSRRRCRRTRTPCCPSCWTRLSQEAATNQGLVCKNRKERLCHQANKVKPKIGPKYTGGFWREIRQIWQYLDPLGQFVREFLAPKYSKTWPD